MTDLAKLTMLIDEVANVESHLKMGEMSWFLNSDEIAAHLLKNGLTFEKKEEMHKAENCRYPYLACYMSYGKAPAYHRECMATKELDPCRGDDCPHWKPKEQEKSE